MKVILRTDVSELGKRGDVLVVAPYQATVPGLTTLTTITSSKLKDSDAELIADFSAAMKKTLTWAKDPANEKDLRQAIKDNLELPEPVADSVRLPAFGWELDRAGLEQLATLAQKYRVLDRRPGFDRLIQQQ